MLYSQVQNPWCQLTVKYIPTTQFRKRVCSCRSQKHHHQSIDSSSPSVSPSPILSLSSPLSPSLPPSLSVSLSQPSLPSLPVNFWHRSTGLSHGTKVGDVVSLWRGFATRGTVVMHSEVIKVKNGWVVSFCPMCVLLVAMRAAYTPRNV